MFEAKGYVSLLEKGNVTGYELSKQSGIPSSKVYSVLNSLVRKEFIVPLESRPVRYLPKPPREVIGKYFTELKKTLTFLRKTLDIIRRRSNHEKVVTRNILGKKEVLAKTREVISGTKRTLYIALWKEEARYIQAALEKVKARGIKIYVVAYGPVPIHFAKVYHHAPSDPVFRERKERRLVVISDDRKALFASFSEEDSDKALWTDNKGLVLLLRDFIIHEIYIVKIREAFPREISKTFGSNWEKIRLPSSPVSTRRR